jgi:AcrR family transcriptional regulator
MSSASSQKQAGDFREATLLWRGPKRPAQLRPVLGRSEIVGAAMAIADAEGLEAVSMRRIAASLGFGTTSLYWYVKSKEELFQLMFDAYMGEDEVPPHTSGGWREYAKQLASEARMAMHHHPWVPRLGIQLGLGPESLRYYRAATSIFIGFDLEPDAVVRILATLVSYVMGVAHNELAREHAHGSRDLPGEVTDEDVGRYVEEVFGAPDPGFARLLKSRMALTSDEIFEFGLDSLLDGIASRYPRLRAEGAHPTRTPRARRR